MYVATSYMVTATFVYSSPKVKLPRIRSCVKVKYLQPLCATVVRRLAPIACMGYCSRTVESGAVWLHNTHETLPHSNTNSRE